MAYVEQEGALSLKLVDNVYTVEASSGDVALVRPNGVAFEESSNYEFTHAEPAADGGFVAVMRFSDGLVSLRWFDASGTMVDWTGKAEGDTYLDRESELNLDINGDGVIEPAATPEQVVESDGAATLKVVDGVYVANDGSGDVTLARANGVAFEESSNYEFTHAEPAADGGFVAVMRFSDGLVSLRWFDASGTMVDWTGKAEGDTYLDRESELNLDINGDGVIEPAATPEQVVESDGAATLKVVDGVYVANDGSGDVTLARANGVAFEESSNYEFTHAEPAADGGFVAVMRFSDGLVSLRWFDASGTMVDWTGKAEGDTYLDRESELNLDINGDGVIEPAATPEQVVESDGAATLKVVDGVYVVNDGAGDVTLARPNGVAFEASDTYEFTHAEPAAEGGYVAVMQFSDGLVSLRWFDSTGLLTDWTGKAALDTYIEREAEIGIDLNGDGVLSEPAPEGEVIDTDGDATLTLTADGYTLTIGDVTVPVVNDSGTQVTPTDDFEMVNLVRQDWGGGDIEYLAVGKHLSSNEYEVFIFDGEANFLEVVGPMPENVLLGYELADGVDFTGDGVIGRGDAAQSGVTSELSGHWSNEGAIFGTAGGDDIVVGDVRAPGTDSREAWVDIFGGEGDDILVGGEGENFFIGGAGNDTFIANEDSDEAQEAVYLSHGNGATTAPQARMENGDVIVYDDTGDLYRVNLSGDFGTVTDLSTADGVDEGTDTMVGIQSVYVLTDQGEIGIQYDSESGTYVFNSSADEFIEIEQDEWGMGGEIHGTNASETIDVSQREEFSEFGAEDWIDIEGKDGDDILIGHDGENWIEGGRGDDLIDGGAGWDTAGYEVFDLNDYSAFLDYVDNGDGSLTVTKNGTGIFDVVLNLDGTGTVTDLRSGPENLGTDTLTNIEAVTFEGTVDWMEITVDDSGAYAVTGTKYADFNSDEGYIDGTQFADTLEVSAEHGFDPNDEFSHVSLWGGGGDDIMTGHAGNNWFEGGAGNDTIDGGDTNPNSWNSAGYYSLSYSAFDRFWDSEDGLYAFDFREEADGSLTVFVNDQDLYNISLEGQGWVNDLWAEDGDTGNDTLVNINQIEIDTSVGNMSISYDPEFGYDVWGYYRDTVYAEGWGDGSGAIYGSSKDDVVNAADFDEVDASRSDTYIDFYSSEGDDVMTGHAGSNSFYTEAGDGNDTMNGGDGYDSVSYSSYDEWAFDQFTSDGRWDAGIRDNGGNSFTLFVDGVDLYEVLFDTDYNATVTDLWMDDGDTGVDQLTGIEDIYFDSPVGWGGFTIDPEFGIDFYFDDNQPDVEVNPDGSARIVGTDNDDDLIVADFTELDQSASNTIDVEGGYGSDYIQGHAGNNTMIGGDGDDVLDGLDGWDTAVYLSEDWNNYDDSTGDPLAPAPTYTVNGTEVWIGTEDMGDLYRVELDGELAIDSVGDTEADASTALSAGSAVRSAFETADDRDVFEVTLEAGQTYVVRSSADYTDGEGAEPWVDGISDAAGNGASGNWYEDWDDNGRFIEFTPDTSGQYFVAVRSDFGETGDYSLEVLPQGTDTPAETVHVPSDFQQAIIVEDLQWDAWMEGTDAVMNTEQLHFEITGNGFESAVDIEQTDTGYDIVVNGVKQEEVSMVA
ncbi:MAG: hypothetical protein ACQEV6_08165 [Pseudomonadota bacterium]